jgi:hypothetical protein
MTPGSKGFMWGVAVGVIAYHVYTKSSVGSKA